MCRVDEDLGVPEKALHRRHSEVRVSWQWCSSGASRSSAPLLARARTFGVGYVAQV